MIHSVVQTGGWPGQFGRVPQAQEAFILTHPFSSGGQLSIDHQTEE